MDELKLQDGARVAIIGGGPAGSMAGFFLLELAGRISQTLTVDLYESRDFRSLGPAGCNMCAGVVSESLVQVLAAEGINLPPIVVQKGIDSYVLHTTDLPPVAIDTPADDLRIATVYRGSGPRIPTEGVEWVSFDGYLLDMAVKRGVNLVRARVSDLKRGADGRPAVILKDGREAAYDLLIGAVGVNSPTLELFGKLGMGFSPPPVTKGFVSEIHLGAEQTERYLGSSMHIFLLDIPGLKFAALIPKAEYVTVVLLGDSIDRKLVARFMDSPEVRGCFPPEMAWCFGSATCDVGMACHCLPKLNVGPAENPYGDRVVLVGDAAVSRLYKDGIGAAYNTAKAAVVTALFFGLSQAEFEEHYGPVIARVAWDNRLGKVIFAITLLYQKFKFMRLGMVEMVVEEKGFPLAARRMSRVLWDTFTGSSTYLQIAMRAAHPLFFLHLLKGTLRGFWKRLSGRPLGEGAPDTH